MCAHAVYTHSCVYNANGPEWTTERFRVYIFVCRLCGAQILAIFEMLTTLGNSRVTFQVHLNEKYVSSCVAWIVIKRVLRTPTVSVEVGLWMERRRVAAWLGSASPSWAALHRLQQRAVAYVHDSRSPTFIHRHDGHICNVKNLQSNRNWSNWGNKLVQRVLRLTQSRTERKYSL